MAKRRPAPNSRGTRTGRRSETTRNSSKVAKVAKAKKAPSDAWNFTKVAVDFIEQSTEVGSGCPPDSLSLMVEHQTHGRYGSKLGQKPKIVKICEDVVYWCLYSLPLSKNAAICGAPSILEHVKCAPPVIRCCKYNL